jgi:hypothetical protein
VRAYCPNEIGLVYDISYKKSVVAIISLKRKIDLATKVKKNGGKVKLYFTLERKAAVQSIVPLHSYL